MSWETSETSKKRLDISHSNHASRKGETIFSYHIRCNDSDNKVFPKSCVMGFENSYQTPMFTFSLRLENGGLGLIF